MRTLKCYWLHREDLDIKGKDISSKKTGTYMGEAEKFVAGSLRLKGSGDILSHVFDDYLVVEPKND